MPAPDGGAEQYARFDFDDTVRYEEPPYLFEYNGTGFSPLGGIQALSGQKKNGKSIFVTTLIATLLNNDKEQGRFASRFPGLRVRQSTVGTLGHEPVILYVDTEQERENTSKVVERAKWLNEMPPYTHCPRLNIQWLREMPDGQDVASTRWEAIKWKIAQVHPDIVFIDGLRDLVHDFNDLTESAQIINELMNLASKNNMCIWCTLHMNPRPSADDDSKMRGHLGTELGNKVSDTFVVKKTKDTTTQRYKFVVKQQDARGKDVDEFAIELNTDADNDIPNLGAPMLAGATATPTPAPQPDTMADMRRVDEIFKAYPWTNLGARYTDIERFLSSKGYTSNRKIKDLFNDALDYGIMHRSNKKYYYDGLNNQTSNDEELPLSTKDDVPF